MRTIAGAALLLALASALPAQQTVLQVFNSQEPDSRLENILYLSIGVELSQEGFGSRRISLGADATPSEEAARLEEEARGDDPPLYILVVQYLPTGGDLVVDLMLYGTDTSEPLETTTLQSPIDIDLDVRVARAMRSLLDAADINAREGRERADLAGVTVLPQTTSGDSVPVGRGVEASTLVSGLLVLGPATEFFRYGLSGSLTGGYSRLVESPPITVGARAGFVYLFNEEGVEGGTLSVVNIAPEASITTGFRNPARLGARLSAGASVLILAQEAETLAKTLPHVEAGITARIPIATRFSLGIEVNYYVLFEPGFPVMGLVPALTVSLEPPGE